MTNKKNEVGLVVKPKTGWIYVRKNKTKPNDPGRWNEKKRLEAVTTFLTTGNMSLTSKMCNIPYDTLVKWKASEWWKELTDKYYEEQNIALSSKLEKTLTKSIDAINDRIENGEYMYDPRSGKLKRVPAKLRDVHRVTSDLIDKTLVLRKQKHTQQVSDESTAGKLAKLAEAFAAFASGKPQEEKSVEHVVEGEFEMMPPDYQEAMQRKSDAFHDQRQEGLQEGGQVGCISQDSQERSSNPK